MNENKLECLRLAIDWARVANEKPSLQVARLMYAWIYEQEKTNSLTFDKISKERE